MTDDQIGAVIFGVWIVILIRKGRSASFPAFLSF